ncbi:BI1-like protein [Carex littledalei]|uniref:BI1-like protein n=1 Tax=Carex littledalei TaxID=544730 RepID=A0A833RHE6_9POAL|nr:BI1-like protein [Carex littledalei]
MMIEEAAHPRFDPQMYPGTYGNRYQRGRWVFLQQVFSSLAFQVVLTIVLALVVVFVPPVANFFSSIPGCLVLYICSIVLPITVVTHQHFIDQLHFLDMSHRPANLFSVGVFTAAVTFAFGLACSYTNVVADYLLVNPGFHFLHVTYDFGWETIFEFVIIVSVTVLSFTIYVQIMGQNESSPVQVYGRTNSIGCSFYRGFCSYSELDDELLLGRNGLEGVSSEHGFFKGGPHKPGLTINAVGPQFSNAPVCGIGPVRPLYVRSM